MAYAAIDWNWPMMGLTLSLALCGQRVVAIVVGYLPAPLWNDAQTWDDANIWSDT